MHNIAPHGATAAEALISSSAVVQDGSTEASVLVIIRIFSECRVSMADTIKIGG